MNDLFLFPCVFGVGCKHLNKKIFCIIKNNGSTSIVHKKCARLKGLQNTFFLRGIIILFVGLINLVGGFFEFYKVYQNKNGIVRTRVQKSLNVSQKSITWFVILLGSILVSYLILGVLPIKISYLICPKNYDVFLKRIVICLIKIVLVYCLFLCIKLLPSVKQFYKFNSAIYNYEKNNKQVDFLTYFVCSIFVCFITLAFFGLVSNFWYSVIINPCICLFVFGINYELFSEIQKNKYTKWIVAPFYFLIKEKPSQNEVKCVNIVLKELEQGSVNKNMEQTINQGKMPFSEAYVLAKDALEKANKFEKSDLDFIFCEVLNKNRAEVKLVKEISKADYKKVMSAVSRRCGGEPITKIFGRANFYGLWLKVTKDVLSPRMDTEVLVEQVIKNCTKNAKVLDIGTGSGAIAIAISKEVGAKVTAVDISEKALEVAKENAKTNNVNVTFKKSDLFLGLSRFSKFDIIVSNPPYIPTDEIEKLDTEVKNHDPRLALDGGKSGLDFYERIIDEAPKRLTRGGKIFFEIGYNQAKDLKKLLQKNFKDIRIVKDYNKKDRVVIATLNC